MNIKLFYYLNKKISILFYKKKKTNHFFFKRIRKKRRKKNYFLKRALFNKLKKTLIFKFSFKKNNIFVTILNSNYKLIFSLSIGKLGYKKSMKKSNHAIYKLIEILRKIKKAGSFKLILVLNGFSPIRSKILLILQKNYRIIYLIDNTKISH